MKNQGCKIEVKTDTGNYTTIYPYTIKEQILGWNIGEVYGPFNLTLYADDWSNRQQIVTLNDVFSKDILYCDNFINGDEITKIKQREAYLNIINIESLDNRIKFICKKVPSVDLNIQVWWTR